MSDAVPTRDLPTVLVPGLFCTPRCFAGQIPALWQFGPVTVADHRRDDSIAAIAQRILKHAPPEFALAGISMGGYISLEIVRQAPERVRKLALICTSARPDTPEQTDRRRQQIELAQKGRFADIAKLAFPLMFHPDHHGDASLKEAVVTMAADTGAEAFVRQQTAIIGRIDSRPHLGAIACPTLIIAAENDEVIPADWSREMAEAIPGATLVTLPETGHLSTVERPQDVGDALVNFWRR
jgi:pimeloyl-ACP methyl ester carboxylesterase